MDPRATVKVGLSMILGLAVLLVAWAFLSHQDWNTFPLQVRFDDTRGLQLQAPVRMSGVKIGEVKAIELDPVSRKPLVTLRIANKFRNSIPEDSQIVITTGLLAVNPQVEILSGTATTAMRPGRIYAGVPPASPLAQISPETDLIVKRLASTLDTLAPRLDRSLAKVEGILTRTEAITADLASITAHTRQVVSDPKIQRSLRTVLSDLEAVSGQARRTTASLGREIEALMQRNTGRVDELVTGIFDLLQRFTDTVDAARALVVKLAEQVNDPRLQQSLAETLDLTRATMARFNQVASDLHLLLGDPSVQGDLKATISAVRETTESGRRVAADVSKLVERLNLPSASPRLGIGEPELSIEFGGRGQRPFFRSNVGVRFPIGKGNGLHLGVYDFAESNKLNAQYETHLLGVGGFRYGLYASKLGIGLDTNVPPGIGLRVDAFDPNNLQVDSRLFFKLNDDFSLWVGAEGLFRRTTPTLGLRLQR